MYRILKLCKARQALNTKIMKVIQIGYSQNHTTPLPWLKPNIETRIRVVNKIGWPILLILGKLLSSIISNKRQVQSSFK